MPEKTDWKAIAEKMQRRLEDEAVQVARVSIELDSTYAHLRAVVENCKHVPVEAIRHQLVGLLPECQEMEPDLIKRLREKDLGHLADRHQALVRDNWAEYGYGEASADSESREETP
jgi:hypothetical protein